MNCKPPFSRCGTPFSAAAYIGAAGFVLVQLACYIVPVQCLKNSGQGSWHAKAERPRDCRPFSRIRFFTLATPGCTWLLLLPFSFAFMPTTTTPSLFLFQHACVQCIVPRIQWVCRVQEAISTEL
ncbi:unnamed protein product [Ixodes pacificus]